VNGYVAEREGLSGKVKELEQLVAPRETELHNSEENTNLLKREREDKDKAIGDLTRQMESMFVECPVCHFSIEKSVQSESPTS